MLVVKYMLDASGFVVVISVYRKECPVFRDSLRNGRATGNVYNRGVNEGGGSSLPRD